MRKPEEVYRELLYERLENKKYKFTQLELAKKLRISLSIVNTALEPLVSMGAIVKSPMGFRVIDPKKILLLWASKRNLKKDIVYQTRTEMTTSQIEKNLPSETFYAAYSAYRFKFDDAPSDYSEVYVYASNKDLGEIRKRFPETNGPANIIALKADENLSGTSKNGICSIANIYVDLWNLPTWYAKEFLNAIERKIDTIIRENVNIPLKMYQGYQK